MTGFISSLSELASLIFQSFRLQALLPAAIFMIANALIVAPNLKGIPPVDLYLNLEPADRTLILVFAVAAITYLLGVFNLSIIRWLEGYPLLDMGFPGMTRLHANHRIRLIELRHDRDVIEKRMNEIRIEQVSNNPETEEFQRLAIQLTNILTELRLYYPETEDRVAPTSLGNVISSAEDQPSTLYDIDSVTMWPLLLPILTEQKYTKFIEQEKSTLDFLLNTLVLTALLGSELLVVGLNRHWPLQVVFIQLLASIVTVLILYRLSVDSAVGWGLTIRASFDLYRDQLRQSLRLRQPKDFDQERRYWKLASKFYREHERNLGAEIFRYE